MSVTRPGIGRLGARLRGFAEARSGTIHLLFGLALLPVVGLVGLGIDYGVALSDKTKLDTAADAAAIAAVASAKAYIAANPTDTQVTANAKALGVNKAINAFNVNTGKLPFATVTLATPVVNREGQKLDSIVSYTATIQNNFGRLFRSPTTVVTNTVTASADIPSYLDFYLLLDVSGSMGLPSTQNYMATLASQSKDMWDDYQQGCQFACHFPGYNGWTLAAGKIQLRSDAVNNAVCSLLTKASIPLVPNQYRIGIYPFINQMATLSPLTSSIATLKTAAQCGLSWPMAFTNLLDTGTTQLYTGNDPTTGTGSGGTHFETVLPQMQATIANFGDGSLATKPKPFVFLVTDGMQNGQNFAVMNGKDPQAPALYNGKPAYAGRGSGKPIGFASYPDAWWDGSRPSQIDPNLCTALKSAGVTISILYIPYNIISFTNNTGYIAWENGRVNEFSPSLATPLRACASPNSFYVADSPDNITKALGDMFDQALQVARLTR